MKLHALYLAGAVIGAIIPLSAEAQPAQAYPPISAGIEQTAPAPTKACAPGWIRVPPGYVHQGRWEPAHCALRDYQQDW